MNIEHMKDNGIDIAVVSSDEMVIVDTQSALDLAMTVKYSPEVYELSCESGCVWRLFTLYQQAAEGFYL